MNGVQRGASKNANTVGEVQDEGKWTGTRMDEDCSAVALSHSNKRADSNRIVAFKQSYSHCHHTIHS